MKLYWLYLAKGPFSLMMICRKLSVLPSMSTLDEVLGKEERERDTILHAGSNR